MTATPPLDAVSAPTGGLRIAYVIPAYPPAPSQPFVVNEMVQVQEAGNVLFLVPLYAASGRADPPRRRSSACDPRAVLSPPLLSCRVVALALRALLAHPVRVLRTLASAHRAAGWNLFAHAAAARR